MMFKERLIRARLNAKLTQEQLANKCHRSANWITQYEELQTHVGFARALISTTKNLVTLDDVHVKIDSLNIPIYTFWGEFDNVVVYNEFKDRLIKVFPNRKEFFITKSGHLPHMENQEEFENIFFKYLSN